MDPNSYRRLQEKLAEAVVRAAELTGSDGKGEDGLVGYFRFVARRQPAAFRRFPLNAEITGASGAPVKPARIGSACGVETGSLYTRPRR